MVHEWPWQRREVSVPRGKVWGPGLEVRTEVRTEVVFGQRYLGRSEEPTWGREREEAQGEHSF